MALSKEAQKRLKQLGKARANSLAKEASQKLTDFTERLVDWYYSDPIKFDYRWHYKRTYNLYDSYEKYLKNGSVYFGGVKIPGPMESYPGIGGTPITPWGFMSTYIYNPAGTWHGGNYHGGYGEPASFSFYNELHKYHDDLKNEYRKRLSI